MSGVIAIFAAFAVIVLGAMVDGDPIGALLSLTAAIIVFGGTMAALMLHYGFKPMITGFGRVMWLVKPPSVDVMAFIEKIAAWSNLARAQGTLALEGELKSAVDPFEQKGLQMIIDNTRVEDLHPILSIIAENAGRDDMIAGQVWESAGGYTPTIGIMGAVLGLIHVMMRLDHPEELGAGIATAFVATIYGVGAANLICLPMGAKLASIAEARERERLLMIEGFMLLAEGKPGIMIRQKLQSFIAEQPKKKPAKAAAEDEMSGAPEEQAA